MSDKKALIELSKEGSPLSDKEVAQLYKLLYKFLEGELIK